MRTIRVTGKGLTRLKELDQKQTESLLRKLHAEIFKMYDISKSDLEELVKNVYEGVVRMYDKDK